LVAVVVAAVVVVVAAAVVAVVAVVVVVVAFVVAVVVAAGQVEQAGMAFVVGDASEASQTERRIAERMCLQR
jgi:hypothetical protein